MFNIIFCFSKQETIVNNFNDDQKTHHYMGIEINIQTWNLLMKEERKKEEDICIVNFAKASLYHWRNSPKYETENQQRGQ
mgnify:CR=1 FL=1